VNSLFNLARVTTSTTGTGTLTLGAAVLSFLTFAQAGVSDGSKVTYVIEDANGGREVGKGTYTASGTTLSRDTVYRSTGASNTAKISCSGSCQVFITAAAEDFGFGKILHLNGGSTFNARESTLTAVAADFVTGRDAGGNISSGTSVADISFQWSGAGGGYRHWLYHTHNSAVPDSNLLSFFINSGGSAATSSAPGVGNALALTLTGKGWAGFGTFAPVTRVHIVGAGTISQDYSDADPKDHILYLADSGFLANQGGQLLFGSGFGVFAGIKGYIVSGTGPAGDLVFQTRNTSGNVLGRMAIRYDGFIGVGNDLINPGRRFTVLGGATETTQLRLGFDNANYYWDIGRDNAVNGRFSFFGNNGAGATELMALTMDGDLGIGGGAIAHNPGWATLTLNNATNGGVLQFMKGGTVAAQLYTEGSGRINYMSVGSAHAFMTSTYAVVGDYNVTVPNEWVFSTTVNTIGKFKPSGLTSGYQVLRRDNNVVVWEIYNSSGSNDLRFFDSTNGLDRMTLESTGAIIMQNLPTSNPGGSGRLWKNGNVVNIT
jgi:hypothetical protein